MIEKGIRGGICHAVYQHAKANDKYMKDYDKNKESLYLKAWVRYFLSNFSFFIK